MSATNEDCSPATCSLRLAHAISGYERALKAMRKAEENLATCATPFMSEYQGSENDLVRLSYVIPNSKVARKIYEQIYKVQDSTANV